MLVMPRFKSWPELQGSDADAAVAEINKHSHDGVRYCITPALEMVVAEEWGPEKFHAVKVRSGSPLEDDRDMQRVRVFYNDANKVVGVPENG